VGNGISCIIKEGFIEKRNDEGIIVLADVANPKNARFWVNGWKGVETLGLYVHDEKL